MSSISAMNLRVAPCAASQAVAGRSNASLLSITVPNPYSSMDQGQAWIDEYIEKVKGAFNSK